MSVDPLEIGHIAESIDAKSWPKYERYWKQFCEFCEISKEKPPTSEHVLDFLKDCRDERELAPTTMWTVFSCLNKFFQHLYDKSLNVSFSFTFIDNKTLYPGFLCIKCNSKFFFSLSRKMLPFVTS